jgi:5-methylcytosine-specific restriction endonuclease McrA
MQKVFVLDKHREPLMPCHPARARELLRLKKASVFKRFPFTIILKNREGGEMQPIAIKIDPGSKEAGIVMVGDFKRGKRVIWVGVVEHRGQQIKNALESRCALRRGRRARHTRYRPARFNNRIRPKGWLPPSLMSRVDNIWTWAVRLNRLCTLNTISQELVKFDTQLMQNAEISGVEYQQGELAGYEVREYLLEKWGRKCAYCDARNVPLEVEHINPKSRGGTNRVSTGGRTKYNRTQQGYPKTHWIDASCIGESGACVYLEPNMSYLHIKATGHGSHQMCRTDKFGFPSQHRLQQKCHFGFQTGDMVKAVVTKGKYIGVHVGRAACRATGYFDIITTVGKVTVNHKNCSILHRADGYSYTYQRREWQAPVS